MNLARDKIKAMGNLLPISFLMPLNLTSALFDFPTLQVHHCLINLTLISMRAGTISVLFIYALINHLKGFAAQNFPSLYLRDCSKPHYTAFYMEFPYQLHHPRAQSRILHIH